MSFRNTAILIVVLIVLGGVVFFVNRGDNEPVDADATPTPAPLTALSRSDVASVIVEEGDQSITVERQGDGWVIVNDAREPAGKDEVDRVIDNLIQLRPTRTLTGIDNLADFGLAEPIWTVDLVPTEGEPVVLRVGDENPRATARYLQVSGEADVQLVPKAAVENVRQWLETPPFPPTPTPEPSPTTVITPTLAGDTSATPASTPTP
jgi:hypothetical protein